MSAGGSFNPSGGPIDNQQRLQTSPNPSLPPADYSMGYARNFQPPSFFNPFSGYYGANTGMGGFQSQFGGFQQPQYGGFEQPQFGGFGGFGGGFQQPFSGGFSQPSFGNPFGRGFNPRTMPPQMQFQPQPPQQRLGPQSPAYDNSRPGSNDLSGRDLIGGGMGLRQGMGGMPTPLPPETQKAYDQDRATRGVTEEMRQTDYPEYWERMAKKEQPNWTKSSSPSLMGNFNPMGGGIGAFGGRGFMGYR